MPEYRLSLAGREHDKVMLNVDTVEAARNEAIRYLGAYLVQHPGFASEGHWRVNVEDNGGACLLHVIVATVMKRTEPFSIPPERSLYHRDGGAQD